jgi:hypothetical protein
VTAPFVAQLRAGSDTLHLAVPDAPAFTVRVEMPEVWDTVRAIVSPATPIIELKERALAALYPNGEPPSAFVLKLRGFEVLDETSSVEDSGAVDGSCYLLTHRYRRPVR